MNKNCNFWAKTCVACQTGKISRHTVSEYGQFKLPSNRFEHIHMDIVGPLPSSNGKQYILTIIDRFTRWPEAFPLVDISAKSVAKTFVEHYLPRFGCPFRITTDQGRQFESKLFNELSHLIGAHHIRTTSYNPKANGIIERFHRQLKASLLARRNSIHWCDELPIILLGIRCSIKEDLKCSPAEMVYGQNLRLPGDVSNPPMKHQYTDSSDYLFRLRKQMTELIPTDTRKIIQTNVFVPKQLETCKFVFLKVNNPPKLANPYEGPFEVIRRSRKQMVINMNGKNTSVSIDRVKPALLEDNFHG